MPLQNRRLQQGYGERGGEKGELQWDTRGGDQGPRLHLGVSLPGQLHTDKSLRKKSINNLMNQMRKQVINY